MKRERGVACARERAIGVAEEGAEEFVRPSSSPILISLSLAFSSPAASVFSSSYPSGLTQSNYKELNVLYEKYKNQGLEILAFPCNQFAGQEPGSNEEIQDVVCTMFKAEFPIFDKVEVNGKNTVPLYKFLKSEKGGYTSEMLSSGILQSFWLTNKGRLWRDTLQPHHLLRLGKTHKIY